MITGLLPPHGSFYAALVDALAAAGLCRSAAQVYFHLQAEPAAAVSGDTLRALGAKVQALQQQHGELTDTPATAQEPPSAAEAPSASLGGAAM